MPLDPQVNALLDFLAQLGGPPMPEQTPEQARIAFKQLGAMNTAPLRELNVAEITIPGPAGGMRARIYKPWAQPRLPAMVFFHGGGMVVGDVETHDRTCRELAEACRSMIVSVEYRLAPENKFPAAVDDAYAAVSWVWANAAALGADPGRIGVGGDSAGANLSAVTSLQARDRGGPPIAYQLLLYPPTDMTANFPSKHENGQGYFLTHDEMVWFVNHYIRDEADKLNPLGSPLLARDHSRLPPAIVVTAEFDPLRDEGEAYAEKLRRAGVPVKLRRYDGMIHGFLSMFDYIDRAKQAVAEVGADVAELVHQTMSAGS